MRSAFQLLDVSPETRKLYLEALERIYLAPSAPSQPSFGSSGGTGSGELDPLKGSGEVDGVS